MPVKLGMLKDVCALLQLSPKTIDRLRDSGKLPGVLRINRSVRYNLTVIEQWINEGCPGLSDATSDDSES